MQLARTEGTILDPPFLLAVTLTLVRIIRPLHEITMPMSHCTHHHNSLLQLINQVLPHDPFYYFKYSYSGKNVNYFVTLPNNSTTHSD